MTAILVGIGVAALLLFAIARVIFGRAGAVLLSGAVGFCFAGPPGAGAGLVVGLALTPVMALLLLDGGSTRRPQPKGTTC